MCKEADEEDGDGEEDRRGFYLHFVSVLKREEESEL